MVYSLKSCILIFVMITLSVIYLITFYNLPFPRLIISVQ